MRISVMVAALTMVVIGVSLKSAELEVYLNNNFPNEQKLTNVLRTYDSGNGQIRMKWKNEKNEPSSGSISQMQYVGNFKAITFEVKVAKSENIEFLVSLANPYGIRKVPVNLPKPGNNWTKITLNPEDFSTTFSLWYMEPVQPGVEMQGAGLECSGPKGAELDMVMRNFTVETADGKKIHLYDPYALRNVYGPLDEYPKVPMMFKNDRVPRVFVAGVPILSKQWQAGLLKLQKKFGKHLGVHISYPVFPRQAEAVKFFNAAGIKTTMESHQTVGYVDYLTNNKLYLTRDDGFTINDPGLWETTANRYPWSTTGIDYSKGDAVMPAIRQTVARAARIGLSEYFDIDFIWPWMGRSGYGKDTVANFRKDLLGQDEGLEIDVEPGKSRKIDFWGYLKLFTDIKFTPDMAGCKGGWSRYFPVREAQAANGGEKEKCNLFIFLALYHYECLKFLQREGRYCQSQGMDFVAGSNPEDIFNGNDIYFTGRLPGVAKYAYEYFGSPFGTYAWYHNMGFYAGNLKRFGRDIYIVGEIFPGGHGATLYNHEAAYAFYYDLTSSSKPSDYNNQYVENHVWDGNPAVDAYNQGRYGHWAAGAFAFLQSHAERSQMPEPKKTVVIGSRNVLEYQDGFSSGMTQTNNLARFMDQMHYPFDSAGKEALTDGFIDNASVLVYGPSQSSPMHLVAAKKWLASKPGNILVTHSAVPFMIFNGQVQLARGVQGVMWEYGKSYSRFITPKIQRSAGELLKLKEVLSAQKIELELDGKRYNAVRDIYQVADSQPVLTDKNGIPLVSLVKVAAGKIIYINCTMPFVDKEDFSRVVVAAAMKAAGVVSEATANADTAVHLYDVAGGRSAVIWNSTQLAQQDRTNPRLFKRDSLPANTVEVVVTPGKYTVYDFYGDKESSQTVAAGEMLKLTQTGTCEVFYFGLCDNDEFKKTLESVHKTRVSVANLDYDVWMKNAISKAKPVFSCDMETGGDMPDKLGTWFKHRYIKDGRKGDTCHSGTRSITLQAPDNPDVRWCASQVKLDPTRKYMLTAWVKTVNCTPKQFVQLRVEQLQDGKFVSAVYGNGISGNTNGWKEIKLMFQPATVQINPLLVFGSHDKGSPADAVAYFDDVKMVELAE